MTRDHGAGPAPGAGSPRRPARGAGYDFVVVGGGIVGLATALELLRRRPEARVVVLEKEPALALHQSGRNSGVVHAGVYYAPGSLKARLCREGLARTEGFCAEHGIAFQRCGKLLVATDARERQWMQALYRRCLDNEVEAMLLDAAALREREPHVSGVGAVFVPATAIVDFAAVARRMAGLFTAAGGEIRLDSEVRALREDATGVRVTTSSGELYGQRLIGCAGLMADRLVRMLGVQPGFRIVPFRGEYFRLPPARAALVRHLIYPVPDPSLPFLGVHLTRTIDGGITAGPNAVLALRREGYRKSDVSGRDLLDMATFPGFWRLLARYPRAAARELHHSVSRRAYLQALRRYCPELTLDDLQPHPPGVRAQAVQRDGTLVHDFLFVATARTLHVGNAPSPAATSAMPIAGHVVARLLDS